MKLKIIKYYKLYIFFKINQFNIYKKIFKKKNP